MQKKIIALAIAALASGTAFAQSNVTLYGNIDMGWMTRSGHNGAVANMETQNAIGQNASQSYIGFKGSEDLGGGLKAIFDLQYRINPDVNDGMSKAGHQYVGLTGGFGTVVAGYLDGLRYGIYGKYNPFGNYSVGTFTSMTTQYDRAANAIAYISPSFNGFTLILAHATNTQGAEGTMKDVHTVPNAGTGNTGDDRLFSVNLIYNNGPLNIDLDYETTTTVNYPDSRLYVATTGASYDFGPVKISAVYDVIKGDPNSFIGGNTTFAAAAFGLGANQSYDRRNWFIGATVPVGSATKLLAAYGKVKDRTLADADASKWSIGARYALSKRTELYTDFAHIRNDKNAAYMMDPGSPLGNGAVGVTGFDFGIKHSF